MFSEAGVCVCVCGDFKGRKIDWFLYRVKK